MPDFTRGWQLLTIRAPSALCRVNACPELTVQSLPTLGVWSVKMWVRFFFSGSLQKINKKIFTSPTYTLFSHYFLTSTRHQNVTDGSFYEPTQSHISVFFVVVVFFASPESHLIHPSAKQAAAS